MRRLFESKLFVDFIKKRKEDVGELKVCGTVLDKIENRINANKNTY